MKRSKLRPVLHTPEELERLPLRAKEAQLTASDLTPLSHSRLRAHFVALVLAELRLLLRDRAWWWYAVAVGLFASCLFAPPDHRAYLRDGFGLQPDKQPTRETMFYNSSPPDKSSELERVTP